MGRCCVLYSTADFTFPVKNDFDRIAPIYDLLARMVFGRKLDLAARCYLHLVEKHDHVLIVGGGTGRILDHLPKARKITYLELSKDMLVKARKRASIDIRFEKADFLNWDCVEDQFDVIILPFFLDVFTASNLETVLQKIRPILKKDGLLIVADFQRTGKRYHEVLIWVMHRFFSVVSGLESRSLQDIKGTLVANGFAEESITFYRNGMIFSGCYRQRPQF
jgi:ubiquinone/menaquinone biosynthesis C-methylase UbiE